MVEWGEVEAGGSTALVAVCQAECQEEDDSEARHKDSLEASPFNETQRRTTTHFNTPPPIIPAASMMTGPTCLRGASSRMPIYGGCGKWGWGSCLLAFFYRLISWSLRLFWLRGYIFASVLDCMCARDGRMIDGRDRSISLPAFTITWFCSYHGHTEDGLR